MALNNINEKPIEKQLWKLADKRRKNIDAAEYKHFIKAVEYSDEVLDRDSL